MNNFGPYLALRIYVLFTEVFDAAWNRIYEFIHRPLMSHINSAVGILISTTLFNCPKHTMVDVCPNENVTFWLYNNHSVEPYQLKEDDVDSLLNAPFNYETPIKILLHGYTGHRNHDPNPQIRPNYLAMGYNVISIDYEPVARKPCYFQTVDNAKTIGICLGSFIKTLLKNNKKLDLQWFHIIAFSMGAHVGVFAGAYLHDNGMDLERLTVLDAAAPMFYLNKNFTAMKCAKFIDAIHTNAGLYGKTSRVAHIDFYVNYLLFQRGCSILDVSCNHLRAPIYFGESIISKVGFWGYPLVDARNVELMGEYTPHNAEGIYYLSTNSEAPFATGVSFPHAMDNFKSYIYKHLGGCIKAMTAIFKMFPMVKILFPSFGNDTDKLRISSI